jgi:alanyl-tRNA synthetase
LSVLPAELPAAVERLHGEGKDLRKTIKGLQESLATHEAARLLATASQAGAVRIAAEVLSGWDAAGLKAIASAVAAAGSASVALVSASTPALVVIARSEGVALNAGAVLKQLVERFGGRGGGKPDLAQGGGLNGEPTEIAQTARALLGQ